MTLYSSTQIPHLLRTLVAGILGMPENRLRVITPEVGGGFGSQAQVYAEEALMGFIADAHRQAREVGRIAPRELHVTTIHGRGHVDYFELAAKRDGTMLGLKLKLIQDLGAYHQLLTPAIPTLSVLMMPGLYNFRNISADIDRRLHQLRSHRRLPRRRTARGHSRHRAHGRYPRRRIADGSRRAPAEEFRRHDEFPYPTATGLVYDSGNYAAPLRQALDTVEYSALRQQQAEARAEGRLMGIGISTYGEICGDGPIPRAARRRLGERHGQNRAHRQGHRSDRRVPARTGRGDHVRAVNRRRARRAESTTSWCCTATPRSCSTASARSEAAARRSAARRSSTRLQELKAKVKKFGAMLLESENVTLSGGFCVDDADRQIGLVCRDRGGGVPRSSSCRRIPSPDSSRPTSGSRRTSRSRSARTSSSPKSTATPAPSTSAATWRWTIAARSSTR